MRSLEELREEIDALDHQLMNLFSKRQALAQEILWAKLEGGLSVFDPAREAAKLAHCANIGDEYIKRYGQVFMACLMELSKQEQQRLLDETIA